jgi:hypothetical protein
MRAKVIGMVAAAALIAGPGLSSVQAQAETKLAAGGSWANEDGSVLTITSVAANGQLTGTFTTQVGCGAKQPQPVTGWYYGAGAGGALSFSVVWVGCSSVTTWAGQYSNATGRFVALWHMAVASAPVWNGIVAGSDLFTAQPSKKP